MRLAIASLASGSSGNCYVVKTENTCILVDAGISGKQIFERLATLGIDGLPSAVLVTHEHSDHISGLAAMLKKKIPVYTSEGTLEALKEKGLIADDRECAAMSFKTGEAFCIGDLNVSSFRLSHDAADPCGYSFSADDARVTILTDTGYVTDESFSYMQRSDLLVLESNHDVSMLRIGRYPWFLKQRILSDKGHLSNDAAAEALAKLLKADSLFGRDTKRTVLLAHLSKENNFPQMAMATLSNVLESEGFAVGKDIIAETLSRTEPGKLYVL